MRERPAARVPTSTLTGTALLLALGVALPLVFHGVPMGGRIFLPMHLPTFVAGLVLGPAAGLVVGVGSPVLSTLLTGMPVAPFYMVPMMFELGAYGLAAGLARPRFEAVLEARVGSVDQNEGGRHYAAVTLALVTAMVAGRIVWMAVVVWLAPLVGLTARTATAAIAAVGAGWIGMVIQLALIPPIVRAIERARRT